MIDIYDDNYWLKVNMLVWVLWESKSSPQAIEHGLQLSRVKILHDIVAPADNVTWPLNCVICSNDGVDTSKWSRTWTDNIAGSYNSVAETLDLILETINKIGVTLDLFIVAIDLGVRSSDMVSTSEDGISVTIGIVFISSD